MTQTRTPSSVDTTGPRSQVMPDSGTAQLGEDPRAADEAVARHAREALKAHLFPDSASLAPRIGRFTLVRELGRGGMGIVYMAYDETLDRRVALKLLYDFPTGDPQAQTRLLHEAQAMARLNHPNIAAVYEAGTHEGRVFVAMEFVRGKPLDTWLREKPRPWREVVDVFIQACRGLHAAHAIGLVHRDFKPANCMLGSDGRVRVLDFGLARSSRMLACETSLGDQSTMSVTMPVAPHKPGDLTRDGVVVGTPAYMPPEQFRGQPIDARTDQFALCVSLYEGLYGRLPFRGDTLPDLWAAVLNGPPRAAPRGSKVPVWLHRIVTRGLDPDPSRRFHSTSTLLRALEYRPNHRILTWLTLSLIAGVVSYFYFSSPDPDLTCDFTNELAGIWDSQRRSNLRAAFTRDNSPEALRTLEIAESLLDKHAADYLSAGRRACEAHRNGTESDRRYEQNLSCIMSRQRALTVVIDKMLYEDVRSESAVEAFADVFRAVPDCEQDSFNFDYDPPPQDKLDRLLELKDEFFRIETSRMEQSGLSEHLKASEALVEDSRALGYLPLLADALRQRALIEGVDGLDSKACATVQESFFIADSIGYDVVTAMNSSEIPKLCANTLTGNATALEIWNRTLVAKLSLLRKRQQIGREEAVRLFRAAMALYFAGHCNEAARGFEASFTEAGTPEAAYNAAIAHDRCGTPLATLQWYHRYFALARRDSDPTYPLAEKRVEELRAKFGGAVDRQLQIDAVREVRVRDKVFALAELTEVRLVNDEPSEVADITEEVAPAMCHATEVSQ